MGRKKVQKNYTPWQYRGKSLLEVPENAYGFIYLITELDTGMRYIGKKAFNSYSSKIEHKLNEKTGRMNKVKTIVVKPSNWQEYFGSNKDLLSNLKKKGADNYKREVLQLAYTKKQLTFLEVSWQCQYHVLEEEGWYNDNILAKFYRRDFILE